MKRKLYKELKYGQQKPGRKGYSHLIFHMTTIFTTISANRRPMPTIQVLEGSNNSFFTHSNKDCRSKSLSLDFPLFRGTAILAIGAFERFLHFDWVRGHSVRFGKYLDLAEIIRSLFSHNMANSLPQLGLLLITAFYAGFLPTEISAQQQICSYFGMNY